jgi:hypothetical protein
VLMCDKTQKWHLRRKLPTTRRRAGPLPSPSLLLHPSHRRAASVCLSGAHIEALRVNKSNPCYRESVFRKRRLATLLVNWTVNATTWSHEVSKILIYHGEMKVASTV